MIGGRLPKVEDMPHLRKRMAKVDENRKQRLEDAKINKDVKKIWKDMNRWVDKELKPKVLNTQQKMAIYFLCDMVKNYSFQWVAARVGVSVSTIQKWRNDPFFLKEMEKELLRRQSFMLVHAYRNVNRAIARGSMKDTWKYLEMTGHLKNTLEMVDRTGEKELSDDELEAQINELQMQVGRGPKPSSN